MATNPADTASLPVSIDDVYAAHARIRDAIVRTPTLISKTLSEMTGATVFLKFENLQFTAAYKERGALNTLLQLSPEARAKGVIAASAGNHAQGLAYHANRLGIPATIVMPRTTPTVKVTQTEGHKAKVVLEGDTFDAAYAHARVLEAECGFTFVHPFDDPRVIAGQGTVAVEMLEDVPSLDTLLIPIGGGGLISGNSVVARAADHPIEVIGVQAELFPSMYNRIRGTTLPCAGDTLAEGIAVKEPGGITSRMVAELVDDIVLVGERNLEEAVSLLLQIEKTVVEGAGAAGLAALMAYPERFKGRTVGIVLCGGNIDTRLLANVLLRDLARSGRLARLRVRLQDQPGALYNVARIFDAQRVNIIEVYHQRIFTSLPAKGLITDIECEARDRDHLNRLIAALREGGFETSMVEQA
ncbi:threonine ammonia-lyase [Sphingomonas melonis TY]|jgi:threonine dehydratase|uniref:Threonine dehydratase n=3 Tax=Sphingomonas TaxID=13687 RepID=A0A0D1K0Z0_9SPHN|nr:MULTISPECIES: threonine ammonia-lyase [Sphingomonas]AOW23218.1 threonine ammonia-lyase [Sphingomonas melonis TY]ATI56652.1 threonine ammonia-lyase [Sphingomonas melonis]KIU27148.1 threonine dehydratase [Sphingomonas melonis]KZB95120.1 threonine ammonia-lyase [Sphingomonas melonis TY]MBI0530211.1 threonine ammonia-lyase [Sphingomonas sp. TX0522]